MPRLPAAADGPTYEHYDQHEHPQHEYQRDRDNDIPGVDNPCFVEIIDDAGTIQTRDLPPGIIAGSTTAFSARSTGSLPDILNSHLPPPYEAVVVERDPRRPRTSQRTSSRRHQDDDCEKHCCHSCWTALTRFRWLLWTLSALGVCCAIVGVVLGALHMTGSSFLTLSLMFVGLGVMLIIVVLIGWRCTPPGHEPCHLLLNLGDYARPRRRHASSTSATSSRNRRRRSRPDRDHSRRNHWSGGVIYADHEYRQPPPSYAAAMHDYERQLLARLSSSPGMDPNSLPNSPPPTYKSQASLQRPGLRCILNAETVMSGPPTYRSQAGTIRPSLMQHNDRDAFNNLDRGNIETDNQGVASLHRQMNIANITVHSAPDAISHGAVSLDDNLSCYYGTAERQAVQCLENTIREVSGIRGTLHDNLEQLDEDDEVQLGDAEDNVDVQEHELASCSGDLGNSNNADVLNSQEGGLSRTTQSSQVHITAASLLRAPDQNLIRQHKPTYESENGTSSPCVHAGVQSARFVPRAAADSRRDETVADSNPFATPRFGSARESTSRSPSQSTLHARSNSVSAIVHQWPDHVRASLV